MKNLMAQITEDEITEVYDTLVAILNRGVTDPDIERHLSRAKDEVFSARLAFPFQEEER